MEPEKIPNRLRELEKAGLDKKKNRVEYSELLVALELVKRGHKIEMHPKGADIEVVELGKKVEVKSGKYDKTKRAPSGTTDASFTDGAQIIEGKFDYCVFVTFDGGVVQEKFVFTRDELLEVAEPRKEIASWESTNPRLLNFFRDFNEYRNYIRHFGSKEFEIEKDLITHPERYNNAWDKIS